MMRCTAAPLRLLAAACSGGARDDEVTTAPQLIGGLDARIVEP